MEVQAIAVPLPGRSTPARCRSLAAAQSGTFTPVAARSSGAPTADPALLAEEMRLARAAAAGKGPAFATLYERYEGRAYNLAYRISGSPDDAADAVQDAFLSVVKRLPSLAASQAPRRAPRNRTRLDRRLIARLRARPSPARHARRWPAREHRGPRMARLAPPRLRHMPPRPRGDARGRHLVPRLGPRRRQPLALQGDHGTGRRALGDGLGRHHRCPLEGPRRHRGRHFWQPSPTRRRRCCPCCCPPGHRRRHRARRR